MARDKIFEGTGEETYLLSRFRDFYSEVIRLKHQIGHGEWLFIGEENERFDAEPAPNAIWQVLLTHLERQALAAQRSGGHLASTIYAQAQYVMAALADETFLNLDWPGQEMWRTNLLESKLFQSHSAGETLFERLDELLADQDPVFLELAQIYLDALALGFQGKYRDEINGHLELANYRRRLLTFITQREPALLDGKERLVPQAYTSVLDQGRNQQLPYLRRWVMAFITLLVLWVVASYPIWRELTDEMRGDIDKIRAEAVNRVPAEEESP